MNMWSLWIAAGLFGAASAPAGVTVREVITNHAGLVHANYQAATEAARRLHTALNVFLDQPAEDPWQDAREAYLAARPVYGTTEAFRFYDGPIDDADGPEGLINAWPLDESYIDAVINDPAGFPVLSEALLAGRNEKDGERNISTGYHAMEYLLWGRDTFAEGPGRRLFTDYLPGASAHATRRADYLRAVAGLLVRNLESVTAEWTPEQSGNYAAEFLAADSETALQRILTGIGMLAGDELSKERLYVAYETQDQEEEHSCFSDSTLQDLEANLQGIANVYFGRFGGRDGPGLDELVEATNGGLNQRVTINLDMALAAIRAIPAPFDQAILGDDGDEGRRKIIAAVQQLENLARLTVKVATRLGVTINLTTDDASSE